MSNTARITKLTHDRVLHLVTLVEHVCEDGIVSPIERRMVAAAAHDALTTARASDAADQFQGAVGRATSERYISRLALAYQQIVDELPDAAA